MRSFGIAASGFLVLPATALAVAAGTVTFKGKTSQGDPVVIRVAQGMVKAPSGLTWSARCGSFVLSGTVRFVGQLGADGSFAPPSVHSVATAGRTKLRVTSTVRLKVSGRAAHGTFTGTATSLSSGTHLGRCTIPRITFTARS